MRDAALLARAEAAWQATEELDQRMQALEEQTEPHRLKMEEISERMDRLTSSPKEEESRRRDLPTRFRLGSRVYDPS